MMPPVSCVSVRFHSISKERLTKPEIKVKSSSARCLRLRRDRVPVGTGTLAWSPLCPRATTAAPAAAVRLQATATNVVASRPISSMSTSPLARVPSTAPMVLTLYRRPIQEPTSELVRTMCRVRTGSVAPIRIVAGARARKASAKRVNATSGADSVR